MNMIFRGISADDDWQFGQGVGSYFKRDKAVNANLRTRLLFFLNDCFFAMNVGIDWWNLLGSRNPAAKANIILAVRQTIIQSEGVVRINTVDVTVDPITRRATTTWNIDTIYSRNVTGSASTA